jgi:hypothetical protein
MTREPSLATLKALAEAISEQVTIVHDGSTVDGEKRVRNWDKIRALVDRYRSEIAPRLRTRAEVDAEIVVVARELGRQYTVAGHNRLSALSAEPTAPEKAPDDLPWDCPRCRP